MRGNNWRDKRKEQYETHNRKPGAGKWWKIRANRYNRRRSNRIRSDMVQGRMDFA